MIKWTLEEAQTFLRNLSGHIATSGYEVALAGSVLKKGSSEKDLDVVLFPKTTARYNRRVLYRMLEDFGMVRQYTVEEVQRAWRLQGSMDTKHVEIWKFDSRRVDLFFLS